jgi:hypothetical protein
MSNSQLTDERLRTHTLGQTNSERLCIDVLGLNRRYSQVKPRRPLGGPDQGRDIEAILDNNTPVWGAVGFQQMVSDTSTEKRAAKKKFRDDLHRAKKENANLGAFVFFTNIDLTGTDRDELEVDAKSQGVKFVDIYWRERIRTELDSPRGIMYRLRYLDIPMTLEEQQAFFVEYGDQISNLVHDRFDAVDTQLQRLQFEMECLKPLGDLRLGLVLNKEYQAEELGQFGFLATIEQHESLFPNPGLWIGGVNVYSKQAPGSVCLGNLLWTRNPDERIDGGEGSGLPSPTSEMYVIVRPLGRGPYKTLGNLQRSIMNVWMSKPLFNLVAGVYLVANEHVLVGVDAEYLECPEMGPGLTWPVELQPSITALPWVQVVARGSSSMFGMFGGVWNPWDLTFAHHTPERIRRPEGLRLPRGLRLFP